MVHLPLTRPEDAVGEGTTFINGHRREVDPIGDIADGMDVGNRGAGVGIDPDATVLDRHAGSIQPKIRKPGATPGGHQHTAASQRLTIAQPRRQRPGLSLHGHHRLLQQHLDALLTHATQHGIGQLGIKTAQQARTTHHLGDRNTKAPQDAGELAGNEACAHHHHG